MRYRTSYWRPHFIFALTIGLCWTVFMIFFGPPKKDPSQVFPWICVTALGPVLLVFMTSVLVKGNKKRLRTFLSCVYIEERGVRNVCIGTSDVLLPWDECQEIGIGEFHVRWGPAIAFYFSKNSLSKKQLNDLMRIPINEDFIWVQYSKALHKELMCYVNDTQMKNYDLIGEYDKKRG